MGFLLKVIHGRSVEDPRVAITPENLAASTGTISDSGIVVNPRRALKYSPVWRATNLIAQGVKKLPVYIYRRVDAGKERAVEHPSYYRILHEPNAEVGIGDFKETITAHAILGGNGYAYIYRAGDGTVDEMYMLDPDRVTPVRENGRLRYVYQFETGEMRRLDAGDVLHIHGLSWDGLKGMGVVEFGVHSIGMGMAAQKYSSKFFANGARPSIVLEHPATIDEAVAKRLKAQWNNMHAGLDNSHKTAVLEEGMKANVIGINAKDAQLIEGMDFSIRDIANWFGCPPHKLGDNSRTAYNSIEAENQAFLDECLDVWLVAWEHEIRRKMLTEAEKRRDTYVVEFLRQALVRANLEARGNYYTKALAGRAWMTPDEARALETMNTLGGDAGELKDPINNFGAAADQNQDAKDPAPAVDANRSEIAKAATAAMHDAVTRMQKRFRVHLAKKTRAGIDGVEASRQTWGEHAELITEALMPCVRLVAAVDGRDTGAVLAECRALVTQP